jgi:hypothetical protein
MKIPSNKQGESRYMPIGMSKKVYKEMVKEMNIIASQEEASQRRASEVCNHSFILLCTSNLIIL